MDELKACPFCGGEAKTSVNYNECGGGKLLLSAYVECSICGIYKRERFDASNMHFSDFIDVFEKVIGRWNQRV